MLQIIHVVQIVLGFIVAGATGMETTMPQYDNIWAPIQLLATTVLTVLGLVGQPISNNSVSGFQTKALEVLSRMVDKINENASKLSAFIGVGLIAFFAKGCIPNPISQIQTFQQAEACVQQNWGQDFAAIEAACLPGQDEVIADIILDVEAVIEWAQSSSDAGTADASNGIDYRKEIYVMKYSNNPVVHKRIINRGLVVGK